MTRPSRHDPARAPESRRQRHEGDAIPAGNYHLVVRVDWFGPMTPPADVQSGLGFEVRLPIRIEQRAPRPGGTAGRKLPHEPPGAS